MSSALGLLEVAGLIRRAGGEEEEEYLFRHTLLRETAYSSLLREEQKTLHGDVGEAIERVYPHTNGEYASVLAHHFLKGGQKEKAFDYLCKAGDEAARVYALAEALDHYANALELAQEGQGDLEEIQYLYERRGRMLELAGEYEAAVGAYGEMEEFGEERGSPSLQVRGLVRRANVLCLPNSAMDLERGEELSKRALQLAEEQGDGEAQCLAHWNLMKKHEFEEEHPAALKAGQRALQLAEELDLSTQRAFILNDLTGIYLNMGRFKEGRRVNLEVQQLWRELDNLPMLTDSLCNQMTIDIFEGNFEEALEISDRAAQISERIGNLWGQSYSRYMVHWVHFDQGEIQRALQVAQESMRYAEQARFVVPLVQTRAEVGLIHAFMGDHATALAEVEAAVENAERYLPTWKLGPLGLKMLCLTWSGDLDGAREVLREIEGRRQSRSDQILSFLDFMLSLSLPEMALAEGRWEEALRASEASADTIGEQGIELVRPDFFMFSGMALLQGGDHEGAQEKLAQARRLMEGKGSKRNLWRVLSTLSRIAEERGDEGRARELRAQARDVIDHIASHAPTSELRDAFLRRSAVQEALGSQGAIE